MSGTLGTLQKLAAAQRLLRVLYFLTLVRMGLQAAHAVLRIGQGLRRKGR
ncbi:MAG: hypothetical protein IJT44_10300 [Clostridia bacterium]|nr:hypothetical protein [Clostridia bacterium]